MGLPTHVGYYEATRGSTILRAKTPMYLIRPVNGSDSVLAMNHNKTSLRGKGDSNTSTSMNSDDYSISTLHSNDSTSISDPSKMIKKKKKQKNYQNDLHIQVNTLSPLLPSFHCF